MSMVFLSEILEVAALVTSSVIVSPSRTAASGPPAALSGETCSTTVPNAPPDMRESVMRT